MLEHFTALTQQIAQDWTHYIPFACIVAGKPVPENRPAMTRIVEQSFVGIVAAALGSYVTLQTQSVEIDNLKEARKATELVRLADQAKTAEAIKESEARVTAQITELRGILLKKD